MKKHNIYQIVALLTILAMGLISCEETVWPDVTLASKTDYLGSWKSKNYRSKITYTRTQDLATMNFSSTEAAATETVDMQFDLGIARASGKVIEDSIRITTTVIDNGTAKTPVIKTGYYTIGKTTGSDYTNNSVYLNVWEKKANLHTGFANPIAEPYTTYTVVSKTESDMELSWVLYNNTAQSSFAYKVVLEK